MRSDWNDFRFVVQMPHMAPGEKLSEVEFLKLIAAYQWEAIARALGRRPSQIVSDHKERLYGSVIDVELHMGVDHSQDLLGEDVEIHIRNKVQFYAKKFVEGLFVIDDKEIPDSVLSTVKCREDLRALGLSWACMTNAFIARSGGNLRLKVFRPQGADEADVPEMAETPTGILEQGRVQRSGDLSLGDSDDESLALPGVDPRPVVYQIVPESDLNGAGLVYFARYEAMMNYGERLYLSERLEPPLSSELCSHLSTEHRKAYFFANASPTDQVEVRVTARLLPPETFPPSRTSRYRVPLKFLFRIDLRRGSDKVLMASSLVRKTLNVPGNAKAILAEAERFLRHVGRARPA